MQASRINTLGTIYMEDKVISKIVAEAVKSCYGIVGLAGTNTLTGLIQLLTQDPTTGVLVDVDGNELVLTLSVIVEYGVRINMVMENVMETIKYQVESMTGLSVRSIHIQVRGIRVE